VRGVDERVDERDRDGLELLLADLGGDAAHAVLVERPDDVAYVVDALVHLEPARPRHEAGLRLPPQVELVGAVTAAQDEHVTKALRGDEPSPRAGAGDDRVRADRRAVRQQVHVRQRLLEAVEAVQQSLVERGRRRRDLDPGDLAVSDHHRVGERPTDIDAHSESRHPCLREMRGAVPTVPYRRLTLADRRRVRQAAGVRG
jgi:hypothetical protein